MNRASRSPLSSLDHNRYLYDEMETREPSLTSCSKISEIDFDRFNDIIMSKVVTHQTNDLPLPPVQQNKENWPQREEKKTLGMMGRQLNYKVLTQQTEGDEESAAEKLLLVILENERLRMQTNQLKSLHAQTQADLIRSESVREGLFSQVVKLQSAEESSKQELRSRDAKFEQTYKEMVWLKARNNQLNVQIENAKRWLSDYGSMKASSHHALNQAQEEINQLRAKVHSLTSMESQYRSKLAEECQKREELSVQSKQMKRSEQLVQQLTQKSSHLEDDNVNLRFEISKLKADLNISLSKEKDLSMDLSRAEAMIKHKDTEHRQECKRILQKMAEVESERQKLEQHSIRLEKEKKHFSEEIRHTKDIVKAKQQELDDLRKGKQIEADMHKSQLKRMQQEMGSDKQTKLQRIRCLQDLVEKLRNEQQVAKQEYAKTLGLYRKELEGAVTRLTGMQQEKSASSAQEIAIAKLRAENSALKDEISEQYRSILMFENKIKAYELRIKTLEHERNTREEEPAQDTRNHKAMPTQNSNQSEPILRQDRCLRRNYQTQQQQPDKKMYTTESLRPKSLTHHYPSTGTIRPNSDTEQFHRRERRRCASRDRMEFISTIQNSYIPMRTTSSNSVKELREDSINITLPLRREHHLSRPQHQRKESLNEAIVRKCRVMNC